MDNLFFHKPLIIPIKDSLRTIISIIPAMLGNQFLFVKM